MVVVQRLNDFILNEHALPLNYSFGPWHKYSQYLPSFYRVVGSLFIGELHTLLKHRYVFGSSPIMHQADQISSIDIDTEADFRFAQYFYSHPSL